MNQHTAQELSEKGMLPDAIIRAGIRHLLRERLAEISADDIERAAVAEQDFLDAMRSGPVAEVPELANEQHYEVPAEFFDQVLGGHRKYSCGYWPAGVTSLDDAEAAALAATVDHAAIQDGHRILELGCGWGSLTLYMADRFPGSEIVAVSNSRSQGRFIRDRAAAQGLSNVRVVTADMNDFQPEGRFDRIVSVEMFEHMRNWEALLGRAAEWLNASGRLFVHIFVHRRVPYLFEDKGPADWMSRHFFAGGMMPSADLPLRVHSPFTLERRWFWSGEHYARTCNAWLERMDARRSELRPLFEQTYGRDFAGLWWQRWRMFFMACAVLFAYRDGQEWFVAHYRFAKEPV
ncbi:MAG: class I SAM-dependent methyltransferase [Gammaproteobacteria bacterium]|nr:class I SAM-dependent methyltransferase [Gammaproteobacteria bacterium]